MSTKTNLDRQKYNMYHVGRYLDLNGYFTTAQYIKGLSTSDIERTLGFAPGRLSCGYLIALLANGEVLRPQDFELKASTRWSAGLVGSTGSPNLKEIEELLIARKQNITQLKEKVCFFFATRNGNTPAKIIPREAHSASTLYPDAEALGPGIRSGVPQFILTSKKRFIIVNVV